MELQSGKSFDDVALKFSADPSVAQTKATSAILLSFHCLTNLKILFTIFPRENFQLHINQIPVIIFLKILGKEKQLAELRFHKFLLLFLPEAIQLQKSNLPHWQIPFITVCKKVMILENLPQHFSNDVVSSASNGSMPEFGLGTFDPAFEAVAFSLLKDGAISKPFLTNHGYHIIKRTSLTPPNQ